MLDEIFDGNGTSDILLPSQNIQQHPINSANATSTTGHCDHLLVITYLWSFVFTNYCYYVPLTQQIKSWENPAHTHLFLRKRVKYCLNIWRSMERQKTDFLEKEIGNQKVLFHIPYHIFHPIFYILPNSCWWNALRKKCPYSELFWSVFSRIQPECRKIWTRITPNTDTFHTVMLDKYFFCQC